MILISTNLYGIGDIVMTYELIIYANKYFSLVIYIPYVHKS